MLFEKQIEYFEKNQYGQQYKIFYKKTVKHFSLSNPADRHSFPERYDIPVSYTHLTLPTN